MSSKTPSRRYKTSFKSPLPNGPSSSNTTVKSPESEKEEFKKLQALNEELDEEIQDLQNEGCQVEELQSHIDKLHEYNDIKDAGQLILGRLATVEGITTRALYERYQLKEED